MSTKVKTNIKENMFKIKQEQKQKSEDKDKLSSRRKHATNIKVDVNGDGDMSKIRWTDGSVKSLGGVFGRNINIVVNENNTKIINKDDNIAVLQELLGANDTDASVVSSQGSWNTNI